MRYEITSILEHILFHSDVKVDDLVCREIGKRFEPEDLFEEFEHKLHTWANQEGYVKAYDSRNRVFSCDDCSNQHYKTRACCYGLTPGPGEKICDKFTFGGD